MIKVISVTNLEKLFGLDKIETKPAPPVPKTIYFGPESGGMTLAEIKHQFSPQKDRSRAT